MRFPVEHAFVKLATGAMRLAMIDHGVRIAVLLSANHVKPVDCAFAAFFIECDRDVMTRKLSAQIDIRCVVSRAATETCRCVGNVKRRVTLALHLVMLHARAGFRYYVYHGVREASSTADSRVTLDDRCGTVLFSDDEHAWKRSRRIAVLRLRNESEVNWRVEFDAARN